MTLISILIPIAILLAGTGLGWYSEIKRRVMFPVYYYLLGMISMTLAVIAHVMLNL